jgi:UDP-GlcNAc:undecaprenyl-phosphate/decaprenyl-phosphate GlcNAc-1-phosphate transferase
VRDYLFILIIAAAVTYLLTPLVRSLAVKINAQHAARSRDVHKEPTPLIGGLAMYGGLVAALLVAERLTYLKSAFPSVRTVNGLLAAGGLLVIIGIVDDRWGMSAISKLAGQIAAGGILAWSGVYLPWLPLPGGDTFVLEPDLSYTLTILLVVITINAVNFIDGLDGLAAGVVGIAGLSFLIYSYTLTNSLKIPSQSVPAVVSAVLVGICVGFLPHNFNPARIFMGDTGAMLIGLLLAYGPISSTLSLDPGVLVNYSQGQHPLNRFPTILPLLLPVAILVIPYADLLLAVIRRTAAGKSPFAPDRQHLHHRLLSMGHSHRQSVLLMYLWAALFSGTVVGLSVVRTGLVWLAVVTVAALAALLLATVPQLRPWHARESRAPTGVPSPAVLPGVGAPGIPAVLPDSVRAPVPGVYPAPPVPTGPSPSPFPPFPPVPGASAMLAWAEAVSRGRSAQANQEADGGAAAANGAVPGAASDMWPAAGNGYAPAAAVPDGVAGGPGSVPAAGAYETDEAAGTYETGEAAEGHDAGDPAPHWSLDDFPAPPRYPRR